MGKLNSIQILRGVAATVVLLDHSALPAFGPSLNPYFDLGAIGVDLFFVISGFIIYVTSLSGSAYGGAHVREFVFKRCVRVVPFYWFATLLLAVLIAIKHKFSLEKMIELSETVPGSLLFIHSLFSTKPYELPLVLYGWSLSFEMYFYALAALSLRFRMHFTMLVTAAAAVAGISLIAHMFLPLNLWHILANPLILLFLCGAFVGRLWIEHRDRFSINNGFVALTIALLWLSGGMILGASHWEHRPDMAFAELIVGSLPLACVRLFFWGPTAVLSVYGLLALEDALRHQRIESTAVQLGDASYSIYILQGAILGCLLELTHFVPGITGWSLYFLNTALAVGVGIAAHKIIEKPSIRMLQAWWRARRKSPDAVYLPAST